MGRLLSNKGSNNLEITETLKGIMSDKVEKFRYRPCKVRNICTEEDKAKRKSSGAAECLQLICQREAWDLRGN